MLQKKVDQGTVLIETPDEEAEGGSNNMKQVKDNLDGNVDFDGNEGNLRENERNMLGDGISQLQENSKADHFFLKNKQTGRCVHVHESSATNGATTVFWDGCDGEKNEFTKVPTKDGDGSFFLKNVQTGRCVHVHEHSATNGATMVFWDGCDGEKNKFTSVTTNDGDGSFFLKNVQTGRCVHVHENSATNGAKMVFWDGCDGEKNKFVYVYSKVPTTSITCCPVMK